MTVAASPAQQNQILPKQSDIAGRKRPRTWLNAEEIRELCVKDAEDRGKRFRVDRFENVLATYEAARKRLAIGGNGTVTIRQLARDLYPEVCEQSEAYRRKKASIQRWLGVLVRQGAIAKSTISNDIGMNVGLRLDFRPMDEVAALQRGCSSAGSSVTSRLVLRQLCPEEAKRAFVRRYCRRAGRGAPRRFERAVRFFKTEISETPGALGDRPLKGPSPSAKNSRLGCAGARARGAPVDAGERSETADPVAALDARLARAVGVGGLQRLLAAESVFSDAFWPWSSPALPLRLRSVPKVRELLWVLERLDRYGWRELGRDGTPPAGKQPAGLHVLGLLVQEAVEDAAAGRRGQPRHLGYFIPELRAIAKRFKHQQAPRMKRARREKGQAAR